MLLYYIIGGWIFASIILYGLLKNARNRLLIEVHNKTRAPDNTILVVYLMEEVFREFDMIVFSIIFPFGIAGLFVLRNTFAWKLCFKTPKKLRQKK